MNVILDSDQETDQLQRGRFPDPRGHSHADRRQARHRAQQGHGHRRRHGHHRLVQFHEASRKIERRKSADHPRQRHRENLHRQLERPRRPLARVTKKSPRKTAMSSRNANPRNPAKAIRKKRRKGTLEKAMKKLSEISKLDLPLLMNFDFGALYDLARIALSKSLRKNLGGHYDPRCRCDSSLRHPAGAAPRQFGNSRRRTGHRAWPQRHGQDDALERHGRHALAAERLRRNQRAETPFFGRG